MANPAPTINQINAFNATQGTTIDFNIIGGTELVRSNRIYIYDLSDNSLICTHLYVSTESIHELPPNTDGSIVYESGKSSADFVNGAQYYAQIQTFTDIGGTEGGSGLSVAKMFWCLDDPTLTIDTIPSTISTTSYNVSATYNANTSVVSNIIQQYQFSLYSATGSLLQSSGVVVGNGEQQGTSTAYDISYNFTGLSVGSSYYVVVDVTTTQGMSVSTQSGTFTVSIDTPTLGEATVVNNACDGYISVTSNLSSEYGGSGSGEIVSFETDSENVFTKLQVDLEPVQDLHGYDKPWVGGAGKNLFQPFSGTGRGITFTLQDDGTVAISGTVSQDGWPQIAKNYTLTELGWSVGDAFYNYIGDDAIGFAVRFLDSGGTQISQINQNSSGTVPEGTATVRFIQIGARGTAPVAGDVINTVGHFYVGRGTTAPTAWTPYENICPISGYDEVEVDVVGKNIFDESVLLQASGWTENDGVYSGLASALYDKFFNNPIPLNCAENEVYTFSCKFKSTNGIPTFFRFHYSDGTRSATQSQSTSETRVTFVSTQGKTLTGLSFSYSATDVVYLSECQIEQGTTATDYVPYVEPIEVSEQFNVSLTPTSTDTDPYLFKAVGDIYGDRLEEELVGVTVNWNQLCNPTNVTFNGSQTKNGVTITHDGNGGFSFSGTATADTNFSAIALSVITGRKYFTAGLKNNGSLSTFYSGISGNNSDVGNGGIWNGTATGNAYARINIKNGVDMTNIKWEPIVTDLTAFFGNATIADAIYAMEQTTTGSGVAFMRKYFPKLFSADYDDGTLKSVNPTAHVTRGVNIFDGETEVGTINASGQNAYDATRLRTKNYLPVVPNTEYYVRVNYSSSFDGTLKFYCYDADKNFITDINWKGTPSSLTFTTPANCQYVRFIGTVFRGTSYTQDDICINISDPTINGQYFSYEEHTYNLGDETLNGVFQLVDNKLKAYGDVRHAVGGTDRKFALVDLGTLNYTKIIDGNFYSAQIADIKNISYNDVPNAIVGNGYQYSASAYGSASNNKTYCIHDKRIWLVDTAYTDAATFKTAMSGVYFVYEKETTTTEQTDPFTQIQEVSKYGTLEYITNNGIPVGHNTTYLTRDVFGGYIDLVSGVLTVDKVMITPNNVYGVATGDGGLTYWMFATNPVAPSNNQAELISNRFAFGGFAKGNCYVTNLGRLIVAVPIDQTLNTVALANTWLENNPTQFCYLLATPLTYQLTPKQIQTLVGTNNVWSEQGDIELSYHIPITNLLVKRQDVDDVSGNWLTLYSQPVEQASDMDFTFIDFLNQYGKTYKYALVPLLTQTQSGVEVEVEGGYTVSDEVQSIFDGVFISDSTGSQKCKANVGYGNVNMNQSVGSITPIGSQYPIIVTNSNNRYHNGSISGMIVPDDYYYNGNLSRIDMVNKRNELEQFFTNKRAKIIKDWNSNIWLVMIMDNIDCSFDNNYGMGIVTFNANWLEVGDPTNQEDLQATGLVNVGGV